MSDELDSHCLKRRERIFQHMCESCFFFVIVPFWSPVKRNTSYLRHVLLHLQIVARYDVLIKEKQAESDINICC